MKIEKKNYNVKYLYHYTLKTNIKKILNEKQIISTDKYVFFTKNLNDSIKLFKREILNENKLYIDIDGNIKRRGKCNSDDYCILKIPYIDDNNFVKITFDNEIKDSIYSLSIIHEGKYEFNKAKVLEIPKTNFNLFNKAILSTVTIAHLLFPYNVLAESWLDNNYDINWYNSTQREFILDTPEKVAGLAYLVNEERITFQNKDFKIVGDIDLTKHDWIAIDDIFNGNICGAHRILLNDIFNGNICGAHRILLDYNDGYFIKNSNLSTAYYAFNVVNNNSSKEKVYVKYPYTVASLKEEYRGVNYVFLDNELLDDNTSLLDLNITDDNTIYVYHRYNYIRIDGTLIPICVESGDSINNVKDIFYKKIGIPKEKIILKYNNKLLSDERTLADYNIQKAEILDAYIKINATTSILQGLGDVKLSKQELISGEDLDITLIPNEGYELSNIFVNNIDKTKSVKNNKLTVTSNISDIKIEVKYKKIENTSKTETKNESSNENIENKNKEESLNKNIENPNTVDSLNKNILLLFMSLLSIGLLKIQKFLIINK